MEKTLDEKIRRFLSTIAEMKYNSLHLSEIEEPIPEDVVRYNNYLFKVAELSGLPINEVYAKIEEVNSKTLEELIDELPIR